MHLKSNFLLLSVVLLLATPLHAQNPASENLGKPSPGCTLIAPLGSTDTFLINMDGKVVHQWPSDYTPGNVTYLLPDGAILRSCKDQNRTFNARGGAGGRVQKISWDGELLWDFSYSNEKHYQHHDIEPMPNGNVLLVAWEMRTQQEAIAAGRDPAKLQGDLWPETIVEIKPEGKTGGKVVWKWSLWDHLVQSFDSSKDNYGQPADHPELVDLNYVRRGNADWIHMNSVAYNEELDQVMMSARWFNEIWIVDHSTTTEEAASHKGGKYGKGGDLLYRWGNPYSYLAGFPADQVFFGQHDARWIPKSYPGGGNITVFNNGGERSGRDYSSADELAPAINADGSYTLPPIDPFGPANLKWTYSDPGRFLSERISGVERQPNGNTLVCCGGDGWVFEVTPDKKIVWEFRASSIASASRGGGGVFRAPRYPLNYPAFTGKDL